MGDDYPDWIVDIPPDVGDSYAKAHAFRRWMERCVTATPAQMTITEMLRTAPNWLLNGAKVRP